MRKKKIKMPTATQIRGGSWRCQVMVNGKSHSILGSTETEAQAKAIAFKQGIIEQKNKNKSSSFLLEDAISKYIEEKDKVLSPSTIRGYDAIKRLRFQELMKMDIHSIKKNDLQLAVNNEMEKASTKTIRNSFGLVKTVLEYNDIPVSKIRLPEVIKKRKQYLQVEEIGPLINAVDGDICEVGILLAVCLGMRRSEILGLCGDCIDTEKNTIYVIRAFVYDKDNKPVLKSIPKTKTSNRIIPCPEFIMEKIKENLPDDPKRRIFRYHPETLRRHIQIACKKAGITMTSTHDLRHTNAALMHFVGLDDLHAMRRGGWADKRTYINTYSYVFEAAADSGDEKFNSYIEGLKEQTSQQTSQQEEKSIDK